MNMKLAFVALAAIALVSEVQINFDDVDKFAAIACHRFNVTRRELYEFVTLPEMVDKVNLIE